MNVVDFEDVLLVLSVRPALEELMVDWLMAWRRDAGFSSMRVAEHNARHDHLTPAEQVTGTQTRVQFQVRVPREQQDELLAAARESFAGADVHYWVLPLLGGGDLRRDA